MGYIVVDCGQNNDYFILVIMLSCSLSFSDRRNKQPNNLKVNGLVEMMQGVHQLKNAISNITFKMSPMFYIYYTHVYCFFLFPTIRRCSLNCVEEKLLKFN